MFKIILTYELAFLVFWNILYFSNSDIESWFTDKFLTATFVFLSTSALGTTLIYIVIISSKFLGITKILKNLKDPRKT